MAREFTAAPEIMKELAKDEKLLWMGAPEAFPLMNADNKKGLVARWLGCIIAAVMLVVIYILLSAATHISVWLLIILLAVVAYIAAMPVPD